MKKKTKDDLLKRLQDLLNVLNRPSYKNSDPESYLSTLRSFKDVLDELISITQEEVNQKVIIWN